MANNIGDVVRMKATITTDGVTADPTAVTLTVEAPDRVVTTYTTLTSPAVVKASVGNYQLDLAITQSGRHRYRWIGTGTNAVAEQGEFHVDANTF